MLIKHVHSGDILGPSEGVDVFLRPSPLRQERHHLRLAAGLSIAEMIAECQAAFPFDARRLHVSIGGHVIPAERWARVRVKPGHPVNIVAVPGKNALRSILGLVVAIAALFFAPVIGAALGGIFATTTGVGLIGAGLTIAGTLAINALFPVAPQTGVTEDKTKTLYSIGGSKNTAGQYNAIPQIFGRHRISPPYAAGAYTELSGNDQYLRMIFCVGYGPVSISDLRIGETPTSQFDDVDYEILENHLTEPPTLYTKPVLEESVQILLDQPSSWVTRTTADDVSYISVDISFPSGIYRYQKKDGKKVNYRVTIAAEYRLKGDTGAWSSLGTVSINSKSTQAIRRSMSKSVAIGQYDIRLRKTTSDYDGGDTVAETCYWTALRGRRNATVVNFPQPLTLIALRIRATGELSGTVDTLNCIAEPLIRAWNGSSWVDGQKTRNPADHFRHVLQGSANARPVADSAIDLQSLQDWHAYCVTNGFTFEYVATEQRSVYEMLTMIAAAGRAAVSLRDGRWGVVWDVEDSPIVQHFTPRNSWGFSSQRGYADLPHGFRVSFINRDNGYLNDERVVYDDGYTKENATKFEGIDFAGVTDKDLIWKHGRYHIAQNRLQREVYTLTTDFEHLVCTRGDRVRVNHDVVLWGAGAARVKSVSSSPDVVVIDDTFTMEAGKTYSMRFRLADGSTLVRKITGADGEFSSFTLNDTGGLPVAGDLVMFGEDGFESVVLRVKSITPQADLTAQIELVDDAPAIMDADKGEIPEFETGIPPLIDYRANPPTAVSAVEDVWTTTPPTSVLTVSWTAPEIGKVDRYIIQYAPKGTNEWSPAMSTPAPQIDIVNLDAGAYDVWIRAVFENGQLSDWQKSVFNAVIFATTPEDVTGFSIAVAGDTATLQWNAVENSESISHYDIRYSPVPSALVTWQTAPILRTAPDTHIQVPAMRGTYLIKAVSYSGLESNNAAFVISTIDPLTSFNAVELVEEEAPFPGEKDGTYFDGTALRLAGASDIFALDDFFSVGDFFLATDGYLPEGYYTFADVVDLGDVYTSRVTAQVSAHGEWSSDDFFGLVDVFGRADFFGGIGSLWSVSVEMSVTNDDPDGSPVWSDWAPLVTGDVSARAYRFRALLESIQSDVTPVVDSIAVTVDMPDRVIAGNDLVVPIDGLMASFSPAYKHLQGVSIAAQGLQTGDYYEITSKDETGFYIEFKNAGGASISRTFDYVAKGYGAIQ